MMESQRAIRDFLRGPWQIKNILTQAQEKGGTVLRDTQKFLGAIAEGDTELQNMIREVELQMGLHNIANSEIREAQAMAFFGEDVEVTDIEIDGQVYRLGDMEIDTTNKPPKSFLTSPEGNYRLEIWLPDIPNNREVIAVRREFAQEKLNIKEAFVPLTQEYKEVQWKLNRLEQLRWVDESKLSAEQLEEKRELEQEENQLTERVEAIKSEMRGLLEEASKLSRDFEAYLKTLQFDNIGIQAQKEKARKTLNFLYEVGFTHIPQSVTDAIIHTLNDSASDRWRLGFDEKVDFANGQIGFDANPGESEEIDFADKESFIAFMSQMISGEQGWLRVTYGESWLLVFMDGDTPIDKAVFETRLQQQVWNINFKFQALKNLWLA